MMLGIFQSLFGKRSKNVPSGPRVNLQRRFTIISETSQGSMSRVYKAVDNKTGRTVCLKIQIVQKQAAAAARSAQVGRLTEGEITAKIVHPNVVRIYEHGWTTRKEHFLSLEFIDGVSLKYMQETRSLDLAGRLDALLQAAEGLAAVHRAGYIHHDYGPKNLLVNREHRVKLIDFGLAIPNTPEFRRPGNRTGTLQYMAPELVRREAIDERIDIFSFGATAFELLTDRLPYDATTSMALMMQRINQDPLDPATANPDLSPELCDFLRKAIARRPQDRYPSMGAVIATLEELSRQSV